VQLQGRVALGTLSLIDLLQAAELSLSHANFLADHLGLKQPIFAQTLEVATSA
jgi:hypothetical protein